MSGYQILQGVCVFSVCVQGKGVCVYVIYIYIGGMCMSVQGRYVCLTWGERVGGCVCVQGRCVSQTLGWGKGSAYKTGMCVWHSTDVYVCTRKMSKGELGSGKTWSKLQH